jgi:hypothetical protein
VDSSLVTGTSFEISPRNYYHGFATKISALTLQPDGKLLAGGIFNRYNGTARSCLARLTGPVLPPPSPTPNPSPAAQAVNLSTRMFVQPGDAAGIGGFIITGTGPKRLLLRAIGPSLPGAVLQEPLADPVMELHGPSGFVTIINNNWRDDQEQEIIGTGIPPTNNLESAIVASLTPGQYTAVVRGNGYPLGVALIELYDLDLAADSKLANISTRAFVQSPPNVIAGFILGNNGGAARIVLRGLGPSLRGFGIRNEMTDPTLELRNNSGTLLASNDNWQSDPAQAAELTAADLAPTNVLESGIAITLGPGQYTALLGGLGADSGTGVGVIEVYDRGAP